MRRKYRSTKLLVAHVERAGATEARTASTSRWTTRPSGDGQRRSGKFLPAANGADARQIPDRRHDEPQWLLLCHRLLLRTLACAARRDGKRRFYVGHVKAVGPPVGMFDIEIFDPQGRDGALFRERFPALKVATIRRAILLPFERAQK